jgi:hypothetical protein
MALLVSEFARGGGGVADQALDFGHDHAQGRGLVQEAGGFFWMVSRTIWRQRRG